MDQPWADPARRREAKAHEALGDMVGFTKTQAAERPEGEWNVYDIYFEAPRFEDGKVVKPATLTLFFNGVLVQGHRTYLGTTVWRRVGVYTPHAPEESLSLQDHSQPVRFRNIWIRKISRPEGS